MTLVSPSSGTSSRWPEVFGVFLQLGLTAFGGPAAHIGYFRQIFVIRRAWLNEDAFAELVTLCQFLPGPASSQMGFVIGLIRAGPAGAVAAWLGFTLPAALLMAAFATGVARLGGPLIAGLEHGLALVATAVVAQAVLAMARTLAPDPRRIGIALAAILIVTVLSPVAGQGVAIAVGLLAGIWLCRPTDVTGPDALSPDVSRAAGWTAAALYLAILAGAPLVGLATGDPRIIHFAAFYRSGALVFGGGHDVLPLLQQAVVAPGWISQETFLAGYGAAQALPGPLFAFSTYLGTAMQPPGGGPAGALLATLAIFLPGLLIVVAALPFWRWVRRQSIARAAMRGAGAAVVLGGLFGLTRTAMEI